MSSDAYTAPPTEPEPQIDLDERIDLTKPIWAQAKQCWALDSAEEQAASILRTLSEKLSPEDDQGLWKCLLETILLDISTMDETGDLPNIKFIMLGVCSHWFRPNQARWTAAGGFAWPSGWHGVSGYSTQGLPELDWFSLFESKFPSWLPSEKFHSKHRLEVRVSIPAHSARHPQAAIHTLWTPMNQKVFYGFRKKDGQWKLVARSDFYLEPSGT